jgi:hypothetical protein
MFLEDTPNSLAKRGNSPIVKKNSAAFGGFELAAVCAAAGECAFLVAKSSHQQRLSYGAQLMATKGWRRADCSDDGAP